MVVNYFAIVVAAVVATAVGSAWYSPLLFGRPWMRLRGIDPGSMQGVRCPAMPIALEFVCTLVTAYVLSLFTLLLGGTISIVLVLALVIWVGFYVTQLLGEVLWEKKPFGLFLINAGLRLVNITLMALVVGLWR